MFLWIGIIIILGCILVEGFFAGSEIAIISIDKIKLHYLVERGSRGAQQAQKMLQYPERFLGTTLVGTNLALVLASVTFTTVLSRLPWFTSRQNVEVYVSAILTPMLLVFGEIVPKTIFQHYAAALVPVITPILNAALKVFYPVVWAVSKIANLFLRLTGVERKRRQQTLTREELKFLIHTDRHGAIADQPRKEMMQRVFEFRDTTVREIMVPLVNMVAFEKGTLIPMAINTIKAHGFSRFPIYEERIDQIVGMIHAFDLLRASPEDATIDKFIRKACYVPETMQLNGLLRELRRHQTQIAVVVDEYGGALGLVTLEDSLEEIVGEIDDEFDELGEELYKKTPTGAYRIQARMAIDLINTKLPLTLPEGDYETLGGFLLSQFRRIPAVGESIEYQGWLFKVEEVSARAILTVLVSKHV